MGLFSTLGGQLKKFVLGEDKLPLPTYAPPGPTAPIEPPEDQENNAAPEDQAKLAVTPVFQIFTDWTTDEILSALDAHELGQFRSSALLWDWMTRDARLDAELGKRQRGVLTLPFHVEPPKKGEASAAEQDIADTLQEEWLRCFPDSTMTQVMRSMVGMGFAMCQVHWDARPDQDGNVKWWPRLELWHPQFVWYDDFLKRWRVQTRDSFAYVTPGDGQWFLFMPAGPRGWMDGAVRSLAFPCFITSFDWRDWADFNDSVGHPVKTAYVARGATKTDKATFIANLQLLGRKTNVLLCQKNQDDSGYDFEFKEPSRIATDSFKDSIEMSDKAKTLVILGQVLNTEGSGSSLSGGKTATAHQLILATLLQSDANGLDTDLFIQVLQWWAYWNYGDSKLTPKAVHDATLPDDQLANAQTLVATSQGIAAANAVLKPQGKAVDAVKMMEDLKIPLMDAPEEPATDPNADPNNPDQPPSSNDPNEPANEPANEPGEDTPKDKTSDKEQKQQEQKSRLAA